MKMKKDHIYELEFSDITHIGDWTEKIIPIESCTMVRLCGYFQTETPTDYIFCSGYSEGSYYTIDVIPKGVVKKITLIK